MATEAPIPAVPIDRIDVHPDTFGGAVERIARWALDGSGGYVCTPNVDHVVRAHHDDAFRAAVMGARLRVPDGMGIVYGSRIAGRPLPGTVTGRLLPAAVGEALRASGSHVGLLGGRPDVAERAAAALRERGIEVGPVIAPSMAFAVGGEEDRDVVQRLQGGPPTVLFVGLGSPKQELWMARHSADLPHSVLVGVGAAIDVLGGRVGTAPTWMTRVGLEWLYRLAHEPRRLARRYLWDDPRFFWWMLRARLAGRASGVDAGSR